MSATSPWDDRYSSPEFIYGTQPNAFLREELASLAPGKALFVFEGEGRNAVYAASLGWDVHCFDGSAVARSKAQLWAQQNHVELHYDVADAASYAFPSTTYDLVVLIFAHMPPELRSSLHAKCAHALKPGGKLLLEGFRPEQIPLTSGGPKDPAWLYTPEMLEADFADLSGLSVQVAQPVLDEGPLHQGPAATLRAVGIR
jgi:SAM-dependent methyltransferase